ncbi:MAG: Na+/H+ antiporter subunit E [Gammaproteobacteria bacterium]
MNRDNALMTGSSSDQSGKSTTRDVIVRAAALAAVLAATWLLWSGLYKPLLLALGTFSCALVIYISLRMRLFDYSVFTLRFGWRLLGYWVWLGKEIVKSSMQVTRAVLSAELPISPTVAELDAKSRHPVDIAALGNSITLTPGTLTLRIRDGRLLVHSLTREGAEDMMGGEMNRRVARLREG